MTTKHSARFANHGAITVHEISPLGWIFEAQITSDRTTEAYGRNPSVLPCLRLMSGITVILKNARNGKIIPKHRLIHQRWASFFICLNEI